MAAPRRESGAGFRLLDLPSEIRVMIFRFALHTTTGVVKRPCHTPQSFSTTKPRISIAIMFTNHTLSQEAQEAFYLEHSVRLTNSVSTAYRLHHLCRVEIAGPMAECFCHGGIDLVRRLDVLVRMPKMQLVTLQCDSLNSTQTTMREFTATALHGCPLRWTDVGSLEVLLPSYPRTKVILKRFRQRVLLPDAGRLASQYSVRDLSELVNGGKLEGESFSQHSFALFLKSYDFVRAAMQAPEFLDAMTYEDTMIHFEVVMNAPPKGFTDAIPWVHPRLPTDVKLQDSTVDEHGEELVEWASEWIALNLPNL